MIDWEIEYKKETGKEASYTKEDPNNCNRSHTWYWDEYIEWLEEKLDKYFHLHLIKTIVK